jgi:putative hydrolase of the HAD superfamily
MTPAFKQRLANLKGILWDLDNTLYPETDALHDAFDIAIAKAAIEHGVKLTIEEAMAAAKRSFIDHGYGGRVFIETMGVDPHKLHFSLHPLVDEKIIIVHDGLVDQMQSLSLHHVIVTHGARDWALRVLEHLGLKPLFSDDRIHALEDFSFHKKGASRIPFETGLASMGLQPSDVIMVEDQERNLRIPHEMGMGTVLLDYGRRGHKAAEFVDLVCHDVHELLMHIREARS